MSGENRRSGILQLLQNRQEPITGSELSSLYGVSRQIIVQDIALLRAEGRDILATSNGYILYKEEKRLLKTIVSNHRGYDRLEEELKLIVDMGCTIIDVIIDHPVYGEIRSPLMLKSRIDIEKFMEKTIKNKAEPLSKLTDGEHIHTLEVPSEEIFLELIKKLEEKSFL